VCVKLLQILSDQVYFIKYILNQLHIPEFAKCFIMTDPIEICKCVETDITPANIDVMKTEVKYMFYHTIYKTYFSFRSVLLK
jgi:hypothetical protein